jgi:hypothetical protein
VTFGPFEEAPAVWGVGRLVVDGDVRAWPVSQTDIDDEATAQAPRLAALGVGSGRCVLIVSLLSEAIHAVPLERAAGRCGALYSSADATRADAFRVAALVRQLRPGAVLGVNADVLAGLGELGHEPADVLGAVDTVATSDEVAHAALVAAGLEPRRWVKLGPTSAWEGDTPGVVAYDAFRWEANDAGGRISLTNRAPRLTPCTGLATGLRGRVVEPGLIELTGAT